MMVLTPRELEVLKWIAAGKTNRETAEILFLSVKTVEKHRVSVRTKLGLENAAELAHYYTCTFNCPKT